MAWVVVNFVARIVHYTLGREIFSLIYFRESFFLIFREDLISRILILLMFYIF